MSRRYATIEELKLELEIAQDDTARDDYLAKLLDWVTAWIEDYTGQIFDGSAITVTDELYEQPNNQVIWLPRTGVSVTAVKVKDVRSDSYATLTSDEYDWQSNGRLELGTPRRFVQVSYTYAGAPGVPSAITLACVQYAAKVYRNNSVSSERIGDYSIAYKNMDEQGDSLGILDAYRIMRV